MDLISSGIDQHLEIHRAHGAEYLGLQIYDGNPFLSGNTFADFVDDDYKNAGAIGFRKPHAGEWPTIFKNNIFDFEDGIGGNYVKVTKVTKIF